MKLTAPILFLILTFSVVVPVRGQQKTNDALLSNVLKAELPLMGHRNWVVIADSAYPAQTRPGIKTVYIGGEQLDTVRAVLKSVDAAKHVRGVIHIDRELESVSPADAPGIAEYRKSLGLELDARPISKLPHEEIIFKLDEEAKTFRVLILKTDLILPYTSVFIQLDCGYWNAAAEKRLRDTIKNAKKN